ncbi:sugar kinase [Vibrio aestuarianus]|uniref:2-dehydro-3-deoxygluconokinase n=1 Tax=Vibrio aestuarianus TaxID=28171 RepID=A0A9X4EX96_9VIBR|nr:sugar kinase [Vibrio aestuarianus]MDE1244072.1 sugar kinase [Vibrio aestuarianus]
MTISKIAVIGECMVELAKTNSALQYGFGGDTLNTAIYLSRLTPSTKVAVSYLTGLGNDPFSREMLDNWQSENINTDMVYISASKQPGIYTIETSDDGERSFYYWRNDSAAKYWLRELQEQALDDLVKALCHYSVIYLSGISLAILPTDCRQRLFKILTLCRENQVRIVFDNNYRPTLWESIKVARENYEQILRLTDIAFLTFDDEILLFGDKTEQDSIARTQALGVKEIVMKRGADDCYVITDSKFITVTANKVNNVVDTTAAGDSFSAGYMAKRLTGGNPYDSAVSGHALASTVIQHHGAIIPHIAMPQL